MLSLQCRPAPSYAHCNQTVTLYHQEGTQYHRVVIAGAYLDFKKNSSVDKLGRHETHGFLLVLPQGAGGWRYLPPAAYTATVQREWAYTLIPNDKVLLGEGQEIATREQWAALIPSRVDGLAVVASIDPKYWRGELCHLEVGG